MNKNLLKKKRFIFKEFHQTFKVLMIFSAQSIPLPPRTPPPGCYPLPHINKLENGVVQSANPGMGLEKNKVLKFIDP